LAEVVDCAGVDGFRVQRDRAEAHVKVRYGGRSATNLVLQVHGDTL